MRKGLIFAVFVGLLAGPVWAQDKPKPEKPTAQTVTPTLTAEQDQQLTAALTILQYTQQTAARKQVELDSARTEADRALQDAQKLLQALQKPGFDFDLGTRKYTAKAEAVKPDPKK